jgi:hypothetical protein
MTSGHCVVHRDANGKPLSYDLVATDELGRTVEATGKVISRQVFTAYPAIFC